MTKKMRRTWPQRLTISFVTLSALGCLGAAGALAAGQWVVSNRQIVEIAAPGDADPREINNPVVIEPGATTTTTLPGETTTSTTEVPLAEPDAANFLITGADNGDCVDADDPTVGNRGSSARSDTIMVWRINPKTNQLAVLSFPRDLYVAIPGNGRQRINQAYRRDKPQLLIDTIDQNFGVPIDHYIQVDFCAFRRLVEAVGGIEVPFEFPARDSASLLNVPEAGCQLLDADMALSYVRSRKYQYEDPAGSGNWRTDGTSDFGRIARQQDFIRRVIAKVIDEGLYKPEVVSGLLNVNSEYIVIDDELTLEKTLEFANTLRLMNPAEITTYRIESVGKNVGGAAVQEPRIGGDNMKAILAVFRGEATLAAIPDQVFETGTTVAVDTTTDTQPDDGTTTTTSPAVSDEPVQTQPTVVATENTLGVSPDPAATC
ncbi:MAG TPA: LCP family protein [Ilumatobacter sp.]|nr:LCP family protein [Ilumatobacter sp.]